METPDERPIPIAAWLDTSGRSTTAVGTMPVDAAKILEPLLVRIAQLHEAGKIHGSIDLDSVLISAAGEVQLADPPEVIELHRGYSTIEHCPPELQGGFAWQLPHEIDTIAKRFVEAGVDCDPRRIDIYQLGSLICRILTGSGVEVYLQSAITHGHLPAQWRTLLDRTLGYEHPEPITAVADVKAALAEATTEVASHMGASTTFDTSRQTGETRASATVSRAHQSSRQVPRRMGDFRILSPLGGGGMGDVYKAYEEKLDRFVAVKVLPDEFARHPDFVDRFKNEALSIAKVIHPNIVQVYQIGEDSGKYFFAMQFVRGESLADVLKRRGRLPVAEALPIIKDCLCGLEAAHRQGLVHRDVKPGNVLLDYDLDRALLADFGLAKALEDDQQRTAAGMIVGTLDYLAPEQALGNPIDSRADLYSVGILLYQALSGVLPFTASSPAGLLFKHAHESPRPLSELASDAPASAVRLTEKLMARNPADRFQTAKEALLDIGEILKPSSHVAVSVESATPQPLDAIATPVAAGRSSNTAGTIKPAWIWPLLVIVCIASVVSLVALTLKSRVATPNFAKAVPFAGHHYEVVHSEQVSWDDARDACEKAGGHLAYVESPEEQNFVADRKGQAAVWLGGVLDTSNDNPAWKWLSGDPVEINAGTLAKSAKNYPSRKWIATTVDDSRLQLAARNADGTFGPNETNVRSKYVIGYVCEWDR